MMFVSIIWMTRIDISCHFCPRKISNFLDSDASLLRLLIYAKTDFKNLFYVDDFIACHGDRQLAVFQQSNFVIFC